MMKLRTACLTVGLIVGTCNLLTAQQSEPKAPADMITGKELQERIEKACREHSLPAMWVGKFSVDGTALIKVSGVRKYGTTEPAQIDDPVHIGSCTKAMTAVLIGQLCSEGKIRLDSSLKEVFDDVEEITSSEWGNVTLLELMQHRSGAPANFDYREFDAKHPDSVVDARRMILVKLAKTSRPKSRRFLYSNVGFIVLGHVVEKLTRKTWEEAIKERLFEPLQMNSASFGPVGLPDSLEPGSDVLANRPWGHRISLSITEVAKLIFGSKDPVKLEPFQIDNMRCLGPAGRVHVNVPDWSKFVLKFASSDGHKALKISDEVWKEMLAPAEGAKGDGRYAAGWMLFDNPELTKGLFHNGSNTTWYCYALVEPEKHCCILVATNVFSDIASRECDLMARYLVKN